MTTSNMLLKDLFSILFRWYKTKKNLNRVHSHITSFQYFGKYIFGRTQPSIFLRKGFSHSASVLSQKKSQAVYKGLKFVLSSAIKKSCYVLSVQYTYRTVLHKSKGLKIKCIPSRTVHYAPEICPNTTDVNISQY